MESIAQNSIDTCDNCGSNLSESLRNCPTCKADAGFPNVRRCRTEGNLALLSKRFKKSRKRAVNRGFSKEFSDLETLLKEKSGFVVSMTAGVARKLLEDPKSLYSNYEQLVGGKSRKPAESVDDRQRCSVGGALFGSYANQIIYGVLSLTNEGLPTYGDIHCRLKSVAIKNRTAFLEKNSYTFMNEIDFSTSAESLFGYIACWEIRHCLVLAKMAKHLNNRQTEIDWQALLIKSDGQNRDKDDFVEAHIYENFDLNAIESLVKVDRKSQTRSERIDTDLAIERFKQIRRIKK